MRFEQLMNALRVLYQELHAIRQLLEQRAAEVEGELGAPKRAPNFKRPLTAYPSFDWAAIGAEIISADEHGAVEVLWQDEVYVRRTKEKFGPDIWFSRGSGQNEDGKTSYDRLITFVAPREPEPLPNSVIRLLRKQ